MIVTSTIVPAEAFHPHVARQAKSILKKIDVQHTIQPNRPAALARLRAKRLNQNIKPLPGNNRFSLRQKYRTTRRLRIACRSP